MTFSFPLIIYNTTSHHVFLKSHEPHIKLLISPFSSEIIPIPHKISIFKGKLEWHDRELADIHVHLHKHYLKIENQDTHLITSVTTQPLVGLSQEITSKLSIPDDISEIPVVLISEQRPQWKEYFHHANVN